MAAQVIPLARRSAVVGRTAAPVVNEARAVRRYSVCCEIAYGGTAAVHLGFLEGPEGFRQPVAMKRILEGLPQAPEYRAALRREAMLGCHVRHPNVVPILDLVQADGELLLVMEYVVGETLSRLQKAAGRIPLPILVAIMSGVLRGLHAAHTARGNDDESLGIVHRDVSPQNVLVGSDGIARIIDFGVAKLTATEPTAIGLLKGKIGYFAPEQFLRDPLDGRTDVFGAGIVLWEAVAGRRLFAEGDPVLDVLGILASGTPPVSRFNPDIPPELDQLLARALEASRDDRFETAEDFAEALEKLIRPSSPSEVARYLEAHVGLAMEMQRSLLSGLQLREERGASMKRIHENDSLNAVSFRTGEEEATIVYRRPSGIRTRLPTLAELEEPTRIAPSRSAQAYSWSGFESPSPEGDAEEPRTRALPLPSSTDEEAWIPTGEERKQRRLIAWPAALRLPQWSPSMTSKLRVAVIGATGVLFGLTITLLLPRALSGSDAQQAAPKSVAAPKSAAVAPAKAAAAPAAVVPGIPVTVVPAPTVAVIPAPPVDVVPEPAIAVAPVAEAIGSETAAAETATEAKPERKRSVRSRAVSRRQAAKTERKSEPAAREKLDADKAQKTIATGKVTAKRSCEPPYYYDAAGIKRFKVECL